MFYRGARIPSILISPSCGYNDNLIEVSDGDGENSDPQNQAGEIFCQILGENKIMSRKELIKILLLPPDTRNVNLKI